MVSCQRGGLQHAVRLYLAAQAKGDISILPLANGLGYQENMKPADIKTGFITKPLNIDKSMSIYDDASCQTFTEVIVTDKANPYVIGVRMRINHDNLKLRVFVQGGGCSGFQYGFTFDEETNEDDTVMEKNGVQLLIDAMSYQYLVGAEIDYKEDLEGAQFVIKNPNATTTCGCGSSFS